MSVVVSVGLLRSHREVKATLVPRKMASVVVIILVPEKGWSKSDEMCVLDHTYDSGCEERFEYPSAPWSLPLHLLPRAVSVEDRQTSVS